MRYRIEVRAIRSGIPDFWVAHPGVKPGQAQRTVDSTGITIARVAGGSGADMRFDYHADSLEDIRPMSIHIEGDEYHVSATPVRP